MNKTLGLLIAFIILGVGAFAYLKSEQGSANTTAKNEREFHINNADAIQKIFIADRKGNKTTLTRNGDHWIYNGKYRARQNPVDNILDAIERIRIKFLPPKAAIPTIIKNLSSDGIKVELYQDSDTPVRTYYVGGMTNDEEGTHMIMEGSENPYVMHIPSWQGGLRARFLLKGDDWRDRGIFRENPEKVKIVTVNYPKQKNQSFKLTNNNGDYQVDPLYPTTKKITKTLQKGRVEGFLYSMENVQAESFINEFAKRDSIASLLPFCSVKVERTDGSFLEADFHPLFHYNGDGNIVRDKYGTAEAPVIERYHVNTSDGDFILGQHRNFKKLFWAYESFYE